MPGKVNPAHVIYAISLSIVFQVAVGALAPFVDEECFGTGEALANCVCELSTSQEGGSSLVAVVLEVLDEHSACLSALLRCLHTDSESAVVLLVGNKLEEFASFRNSRNMSQVIFWMSPQVHFSHLLDRVVNDTRWSAFSLHLVAMETDWSSEEPMEEKVFMTLRETWRHWIGDAAVLAPAMSSSVPQIVIFTHFPFVSGNLCFKEVGRIEKVAVWQDHKMLNGSIEKFFPQPNLNLQGCILRVATINYPPVSILKDEDYEKDIVNKMEGLHGYILKEASKKLNFSTEITYFHPSRYQNSSNPYKAIFDLLVDNRVDMVLGEFVLTPDRYFLCGEGFLHYWACWTFAVPLRETKINYLWMAGRMASFSTWMAILSCVLLSCASLWTFARLQPDHSIFSRERASAVSDSIAAFSGVSLRRPPEAPPSRMLFLAICMGGLVATTALRAHLVSVLSSPGDSFWAPTSVRQLANSRMRVGGPISYTFLAKDTSSDSLVNIFSRFEQLDEEKDDIFDGQVAVAGIKNNLQYRLSNQTRMRLLNGCPLPLPTAVFLRKGTSLTRTLDKIGQGLTSTGLMSKWRKDLTRKTTDIEVGSRNRISMVHLIGTIAFYGAGVALSLAVFVLEVIHGYSCVKNKP